MKKIVKFTLAVALIISLIFTFAVNAIVLGVTVAQLVLDQSITGDLILISVMAPSTLYACIRVCKETVNKECNSFLSTSIRMK